MNKGISHEVFKKKWKMENNRSSRWTFDGIEFINNKKKKVSKGKIHKSLYIQPI